MKKILIIEDNADLAKMLADQIGKSDYQVDIANDGEEGFLKANSFRPDLITLDLKLPKIDGYRLCEMLKLEETTKSIPIIVISGRNEEIEIKAAFALGAEEYFVKPYDSKTLLDKIKQLIGS